MGDFPKQNVQATVAAIITRQVNGDCEVLLTRRGYPPFQGHWCLPGGHIDRYEPAENAIIREVKEEIGLDFDACFYSYTDEIIPCENIHAVVLVFDGKVSGELRPQPEEVTDIQWFTFSDAAVKNLAFQHNQILENYQKIHFP